MPPELFEHTERVVQAAVEWLRLLMESVGALVFGVGIALALVQLARFAIARTAIDFNRCG